ncbi:MAG: polysaccharide biosynthesis tyrosine autokinase [Kineosporiaceae bacterium]|nr:polysaccharide biosynthesis tyrosine autokinase [Kineosporiaceae bacterium]
MTIAEYLRLIRQNWVLFVVCTLLAGLVGVGYTVTRTPVYQATAQLFVSIRHGGGVSDLTQGGTFTQQRVKSYADLVSTTYVLQLVIDDLHLPYSAQDLAGRVRGSSHLDTVMLEVQVDDPDPKRARDIANTIIALLPKVIGDLETPEGEASSPVKIKAVQSAVLPTSPISPKSGLNLVIALLLGLGGALALTLIRDALDRSVNTKEQAQAAAKAPTLTAVADDAEAAKHQLITHDAFSPRAEAFRQLRTNIRFLSVDHRVGSIVVTSAVPHEGKSTTSANLAIALAQAGESVILIDADLRRPTVADVFALSAGVGLTSVLLGDLDIDEAVQVWREDLPLHVLTAGPLPPNPSELIGSARMAALISDLVERGVTVVLDSPRCYL